MGGVCVWGHQTMEFPITRERLQNYRLHEALAVETRQRVAKEMEEICKNVEGTVLGTNDRRYVYRMPGHVKHPNLRESNRIRMPQPTSILKELIQAIGKAFPDSTITLDPLETYILIDWS